MKKGIIVSQTGAIEKNGIVHIPSHWHFILKAYGELLPGTKLLCRKDRNLINKATLPVPEGLAAVLLENIDSVGTIERLKGYMQARRHIKAFVKRAGFVIVVMPSNLGNMAANIAISLKKPVFVEIAGENKFYDRRLSIKLLLSYLAYRYTREIDKKVLRYAALVLFVSQYLADVAVVKPKRYSVVPHTTVYDKNLFRRDDTCTKTPIVVFSANRIVREKGLQHLLMAVKRLREQNFDVVATLAGDGDYLNELKKQSSELGIDEYVKFPGQINVGDELWQLYRQADIMVLPTIASGEGTPKCIIEAMASSCPIAASSVGGIKMMLEEAKSGKLVAAGNVDELVEAIKQIILDGELRRKYIANGLAWVSKVTLEKRVKMIEKLLAEHLLTNLKER